MAVNGTYSHLTVDSPRRCARPVVTSLTPSSYGRELADVMTRLHRRFGDRCTFVEIRDVVESCRRDLDLVTPYGLPEIIERLATQRLLDRTSVEKVPSGD